MILRYFPTDECNLLPLFSSFSVESLMVVKDLAPHIPRGLLIDTIEEEPQWRQCLENLQAVSIHLNYKHLTKDHIREIKSYKYKILCYTVNDIDIARELLFDEDCSIDAMCTDELDVMSTLLSK